MGTEYVVVSAPETFTIVGEGAVGPIGQQGPIGLPGDLSAGLNISVDGELAIFSGTTGKLLKRATTTGMLKATSGVLEVASPHTDYLIPSDLNAYTPTANLGSGAFATIGNYALLAGPSFTGNINFLLQATENIVIDARTNPRNYTTLGVLRINHTAGKTGTRPLALDVNCNGFADTHAISVNYIATGLSSSAENHGFDFSVDTDNSTGGEIAAISVSKSGAGTVEVTALEVYPLVHVLDQQVGITGVADSNFTFSGGIYTLRNTEFNSAGSNTSIFVNNTDYIYIGHSSKFDVIDIALSIFASGTGIIPTFEYSDGVNSWAIFSPGDTTNGFRQNGTISIPILVSWVTRTVNSVTSKYWIRIRRTNAAAITVPIESTIKIIVSTVYSWNNFGNISASKLNLKNLPTYSTRANAITAGLIPGDLFQDTNYALLIV